MWKYDIMTMWKEAIIMSLTKINPRGQITIPTKFRNALHCKPGDYVEVEMEGNILKVIPKELIDKSQMWLESLIL